MTDRALLTTRDVADQLGVYYETVLNWRKKGLITPTQQVGMSFLYTQEDIDNRLPAGPAGRKRKDNHE